MTREEIMEMMARRAPEVSAGEVGRYLRENPEAVTAIAPPVIPGPAGVRPMARPSFGMPSGPRPAPSAGPAPRFTPASPRFTPPPPRFTPGAVATAPANAPPQAVFPSSAPSMASRIAVPVGAGTVLGTGLGVTALGLRERGGAHPAMTAPEEEAPADYGDLGPMPSADTQRLMEFPLPSRRGPPVDEVESQYLIRGRDVPIDEVQSQYIVQRARDTVAPRSAEPEAPARRDGTEPGGILSRIFSGKDYQSAGGQLYKRDVGTGERVLNWGDPESAADYFRAADAMARMTPEEQRSLRGFSGRDIEYADRMRASEGKAEGGGVMGQNNANGGKGPTKEAMLHKALEIIHHLIQK